MSGFFPSLPFIFTCSLSLQPELCCLPALPQRLLSCSHQDVDAQSTHTARADKRERVYQGEGWQSQYCTLLILYLLVIVCRRYRKKTLQRLQTLHTVEACGTSLQTQECLGSFPCCKTGLYGALSKQQKISAVENILITKTCFC